MITSIILFIVSLVAFALGICLLKFPERLFDLGHKFKKRMFYTMYISEKNPLLRIDENSTYRGTSEFITRILGALAILWAIFFLIMGLTLICCPSALPG
jgi:hypothetical protein